jgi:pyrroline-5-carboxylate reductase
MNILLVGCGRMGGALARNWTGANQVFVFDPVAGNLAEGVQRIDSLDDSALPDALAVVLAVKPQVWPSIAASLSRFAQHNSLFISIMAGVPLARLSAALGSTRIVRAMPNTPAAIGHGITAAVAACGASAADRQAVDGLFKSTGVLCWLDDEDLMNAVTAVSGSGPAYFFRFTEALAKAGVAAGFSSQLAMQLARETLIGAAALAKTETAGLEQLRLQVTSPGGTTAAGLAMMDEGDAVDRLAQSIVNAATTRSRELAF